MKVRIELDINWVDSLDPEDDMFDVTLHLAVYEHVEDLLEDNLLEFEVVGEAS